MSVADIVLLALALVLALAVAIPHLLGRRRDKRVLPEWEGDGIVTREEKFDRVVPPSGHEDAMLGLLDTPVRDEVERLVDRQARFSADGRWRLTRTGGAKDFEADLGRVLAVAASMRAIVDDVAVRIAATVAAETEPKARRRGLELLARHDAEREATRRTLEDALTSETLSGVVAIALGRTDVLAAIVHDRRRAPIARAEAVVRALANRGSVAAVPHLAALRDRGLGLGRLAAQAKEAILEIQRRAGDATTGALALTEGAVGGMALAQHSTDAIAKDSR